MIERIISSVASAARDDLAIRAFHFGNPDSKDVAIIAGLRGSEIQQVYIASQVVRKLQEHEGLINPDQGLCIIPAANPHAMNAGRRLIGLDAADLNRRFPGFERGDTAQRLAHAIMDHLTGYEIGINLTSINHPGSYANHVRIHKTGFDAVEAVPDLGLPWIHYHQPNAQEAGSLNYNWQVWQTRAYSILGGRGFELDVARAKATIDGILRFLHSHGFLREAIHPPTPTPEPTRIDDDNLWRISAERAGIFIPLKELDEVVHKGEVIGTVRHGLLGTILADVIAPTGGNIFYRFPGPLIYEQMVAYAIVKH